MIEDLKRTDLDVKNARFERYNPEILKNFKKLLKYC